MGRVIELPLSEAHNRSKLQVLQSVHHQGVDISEAITENTKEVKVTQNWVEFVIRRSALSLKCGYFYLF
jgi:hypothetical protein